MVTKAVYNSFCVLMKKKSRVLHNIKVSKKMTIIGELNGMFISVQAEDGAAVNDLPILKVVFLNYWF